MPIPYEFQYADPEQYEKVIDDIVRHYQSGPRAIRQAIRIYIENHIGSQWRFGAGKGIEGYTTMMSYYNIVNRLNACDKERESSKRKGLESKVMSAGR